MNKCFILLMAAMAVLPTMAATKPAIPQAPVITYGIIRDEYGVPMTKESAATLTLVKDDAHDGDAYATCAVGDSGMAGMNYRLSLEIDSSGPRRPYAVVAGTPMFVKATRGGKVEELSSAAKFVTPAQGTKQRIDHSFGTDADADGLPDDWEEWVLDMADKDSSPSAIAAFRPGDDADGDGMTNLQEFLMGTNPFLETDLFKIESAELVPGMQRARIVFTTTVGRKYRVLMSESLSSALWTPVATTRTAGGDFVYGPYDGNGRKMTVYVDARLSAMFFRVAAD